MGSTALELNGDIQSWELTSTHHGTSDDSLCPSLLHLKMRVIMELILQGFVEIKVS